MNVYIPENEFGIKEGNYDLSGIVELLRRFSVNPEAVHFIADMLEE